MPGIVVKTEFIPVCFWTIWSKSPGESEVEPLSIICVSVQGNIIREVGVSMIHFTETSMKIQHLNALELIHLMQKTFLDTSSYLWRSWEQNEMPDSCDGV